MANFWDNLKNIGETTEALITQASSVAGKIKGFTLPSISTKSGVPAEVQMTSDSQPGKQTPGGTITQSSAMPYILVAGAAVIAILVLRK